MEDVLYDPPDYVWAITIAGPTAIAAATCIVLYGGTERAGLGRKRAALLAGAAAVLLGGWFTATALIAAHGWYRTLPWLPVAAAGFLGTLLVLSRIPVVARALGMASRLVSPQGTGRGAALWFNAFGLTELTVAVTLGALTGFQLLNVTPSSAAISEFPLALITTADVPLLFALHITSLFALARAPRPAMSTERRLTWKPATSAGPELKPT